jgi:hypothetical protein
MSERAILKTLIVYFLIGFFLVSNVSCVYASSEASADSYENKTEASGKKIQPSQDEAQNSEEQLQPPDTDTQSAENDEVENAGVQPSENEGTETPDNTEVESAQGTETNSSENPDAETVEEIVKDSSENNGTVSSENTEAQSSWNAEVTPEDTGTQTSGETQVSEDTETESSHHTGNSYHIEHSEYTKIENNRYVQSEPAQKAASENSGSAENSKPAPSSASVSLHGEKTQVVSGEDILLTLSAVNLITKPVVHVQVIIIPPSGMSVSSSEFVQSGAGQYTTTYELDPGQGRDIEVRIETNQPGDFHVKGRVVYYFGEDKKNVEDNTLDLPIQVEAKQSAVKESLPGFTLASLAFVLISVFVLKRR